MARTFNGTSQRLRYTGATINPGNSDRLQFFVRARQHSGAAYGFLMAHTDYNGGSSGDFIGFEVSGTSIRFITFSNLLGTYRATSTWTNDNWHNIVGGKTGLSSGFISVDGETKIPRPVSNSIPNNLTRTVLGGLERSDVTYYFNGDIAEAAVILLGPEITQAQVNMFNDGYPVYMIVDHQYIWAYWNYLGRSSPELDIFNKRNLSLINSPTLTNEHASVMFSVPPHTGFTPSLPPIPADPTNLTVQRVAVT